jgi:nucleolar protein 58
MSYALVELPAGVALFKVGETPKLKAFHRFKNTLDALENTTQIVNGELSKPMKKFLKKNYVEKEITAELMVMDAKLGKAIKTALDIPCIHGDETMQYFRAIKLNIDALLTDVTPEQLNQASLGLAHNLNRYKLKFSPDKIDMMVVQAVALLEDLDKEINKYAMRAKEWFGWHFPEMTKIVVDNGQYCKLVVAMQTRFNAKEADFTDIVDEELAEKVREAAIVSMGTEISDDDVANISRLCDEVVKSLQYREQLAAYLTSRMNAIAPNLTTMVGETIGARLIQKAGSLLSLAKYPSSTVQILGAEKALFRALKQRQATPKYGILYHAQLVAKAPAANKGTMSRVLAAKTSLSARIDSFGEADNTPGVEYRAAVEARLKAFEEGLTYGKAGNARGAGRQFEGAAPARGDAGPKRNRVEGGRY